MSWSTRAHFCNRLSYSVIVDTS